MLITNLLLPILLFVLNFLAYDIPTFTSHTLVQSSTTKLVNIQTKKELPIIPLNDFEHKYQSSPAPLQITLATPTPTNIPTTKPSPNNNIFASVDGNLSSQSLFNAINNYRIKQELPTLAWDQNLANYAQTRVRQYQQSGSMDHHEGFRQLTSTASGFYQLGFRKLGENSSSGFSGNPVDLVENLYAGSAKHQENQLNPGWSHMGTGVSGGFTNIVFGGERI